MTTTLDRRKDVAPVVDGRHSLRESQRAPWRDERRGGQAGSGSGRRSLRALVLMDEPSRVDAASDSTTAVSEELCRRGHHVEVGEAAGVAFVDGVLVAHLTGGAAVRVDGYDVVLVRADPPFDIDYLHATLLLEHVRGRCVFVNDPRALRETHEKLYALRFTDLVPPTIVTSRIGDLRAFMHAQGGSLVVKPLDGCGGEGIFVVHDGDPNVDTILETATGHGRRRVIGQRYLPDARVGDKRILMLDGQPIGAFLRRPAEGRGRANLHAGGHAVPARLDARDEEICRRVGAHCRRAGIVLAGLDVIGGWLTEINVTSPAGFRSLERLYGVRAEERLVEWIEQATSRNQKLESHAR